MSNDLRLDTLFSVAGKTVLISGGGSGIGKMMATGFAQNGAKVYIAARKERQLREAVTDINKVATGPDAEYIVGNVGSKAGCDALISEFKKRETKLHVLINNSGIVWGGPFHDFPEERGWDNVFAVNVKSVFYMTSGLTDLLLKNSDNRDPGRVINISSVNSVEANAEGGPLSEDGSGTWSYHPSKAAVNHLTSVLAAKLGPQHITVNAICPGLFPSKMTSYGLKVVGEEGFNAAQPTGRFGYPSDVAGLAIFLSSAAGSHVTGAQILLDGGLRFLSQIITPATRL